MPETSFPPPPPVKSNAPIFIGLAALIGVGIGAAVFFMKGEETEKPAPAAVATTVEPPKAPPPPPPPPPPPEPEPEVSAAPAASAPSGKSVKQIGTGAPPVPAGPEGCGGTCNGRADAPLKAALAQIGASARGCYNNALRNNTTLSGKVTVAVRVAPNGSACGARTTVDTLHEASVTSCILQKFRSAKYPKPVGGCVDGEVPINLVAPK